MNTGTYMVFTFIIFGIVIFPITIIFLKYKSEYLSKFFDKLGVGIVSGIFVSWLINSNKIFVDFYLFVIHLFAFLFAIVFLIWSIILRDNQ